MILCFAFLCVFGFFQGGCTNLSCLGSCAWEVYQSPSVITPFGQLKADFFSEFLRSHFFDAEKYEQAYTDCQLFL